MTRKARRVAGSISSWKALILHFLRLVPVWSSMYVHVHVDVHVFSTLKFSLEPLRDSLGFIEFKRRISGIRTECLTLFVIVSDGAVLTSSFLMLTSHNSKFSSMSSFDTYATANAIYKKLRMNKKHYRYIRHCKSYFTS